MSSINLAGTLNVATPRRVSPIVLSEIIDTIEAKQFDFNIAANASGVTVPLLFPVGVTEALFLHLYSPKKLILELTGSDATPGPMKLGLKGHMLLTMQPDEGIISLKASNPSTTEDVNLEVVVGCIAAAGQSPEFFDDV